MENSKVDDFAKELIIESKLELTNPYFTKTVMRKIKTINRKKEIYPNIKFYAVLLITTEAAIFTLLKVSGLNFTDIPYQLSDLIDGYKVMHSHPHLFTFIYFVVIIGTSILLTLIADSGYSSNRKK